MEEQGKKKGKVEEVLCSFHDEHEQIHIPVYLIHAYVDAIGRLHVGRSCEGCSSRAIPVTQQEAQALQFHASKSIRRNQFISAGLNTILFRISTVLSQCSPVLLVFALQAEALLKLHGHEETTSPTVLHQSRASMSPYNFLELLQTRTSSWSEHRLTGRQEGWRGQRRWRHGGPLGSTHEKKEVMISMSAEACMGYGEDVNHDAHTALLLCNRAACWCKAREL
ncbi:hypothetical protein MUK42_33184 [Musa troglodytarum]|uniref:Uncharacterized protein n=1 Tax=Musa troglodytarum TaxID=320322 RepID=A0A9E7KU71_9LILI|nr:hypothetical protein MUK42_33184 [Musa troglodytarum]